MITCMLARIYGYLYITASESTLILNHMKGTAIQKQYQHLGMLRKTMLNVKESN